MSDLSAWSDAYEQHLAERDANLREVARIYRQARHLAYCWAACAALFAFTAPFTTTWMFGVALLCVLLSTLYGGLVRRIQRDMGRHDLVIEFALAQESIRRPPSR